MGGLQRSDLIIVAGRPAMGKTSIVLNLAKNVTQLHDLPVCVFSLEMSKEQLTYRLLSMEVGVEAGRLRTGRLQQEMALAGPGNEKMKKIEGKQTNRIKEDKAEELRGNKRRTNRDKFKG